MIICKSCSCMWIKILHLMVYSVSSRALSSRSTGTNKAEFVSGERVVLHEVYDWGLNSAGQLGLVDFQDRRKPTLISLLKGKNVSSVAVGGSEQVDSHTLLLVSPGKLFASGDNTYGQLGLGDNADRESFEPVQSVFQKTFLAVACGEGHSVGVTTTGELLVWGSNTRGQLGIGSDSAAENVPKLVSLPTSDPVQGTSAGAWHTVVWTGKGNVYACGDNSFGQLGIGNNLPKHGFVQVILPKGLKIREVAAGGHHNLLLTENGEIYAWGKNGQGQLGLQQEDITKEAWSVAEQVPVFSDTRVVQVAAGYQHSLAVNSGGLVHAWGENNLGQLGIMVGGIGSQRQPLAVGGPVGPDSKPVHAPHLVMPSVKFQHVAAGRLHSLGVTENGKVYVWGGNNAAQLGLGDLAARPTPQAIVRLAPKKVLFVATGSASSFAVNEDTELYGWGKNNAGQLGLPRTKAPRLIPELVMSANEPFNVLQVAAGGFGYQYEGHSMLLTGLGEVLTWGWNAFGQLGLGEVDDAHSVPQKNSVLHNLKIKSIAAGQFTSAAVTEDGEVYTWGQNDAGQLGKGDFSSGPVDVPQRVHFEVSITMVAIGYSHMLALSTEGRVHSWGHNFYGQLGVGDHKDKSSPQLVSYLQEERIAQVVAGQYHSLALSQRGELYGWGYNRDYELGVGDNMDRVLPQAVPSLAGRKLTALAAGGYHSLGVTEDGTLYSWGMNNYGQLGHKERSTSKVPTIVVVTSGTQDGKQVGKRLRVKSVAAGTWHSLILAENNAVYSFGRCQHGQLGVRCHYGDRTQDVFIPERVSDILDKKVVAIAAGAAHSIAVVEVS
mmetsp:Transcript_27280/g.37625  ORF Transcript_27280/g.37625 Transcript_27280/m.37625 type:complete len:828 (+) Transcript_27280:153-2636(+)